MLQEIDKNRTAFHWLRAYASREFKVRRRTRVIMMMIMILIKRIILIYRRKNDRKII